MLRSTLIYLSKSTWAQKAITHWKIAWRVASRFVAGETVAEAIQTVRDLNARQINATLDHLGEHTSTPEEAQKATDDVLELLEQIQKQNVRANVSVKLTQLGLALDENLTEKNLGRILECARKNKNYIRIDMEDSPYTDKTIRLYQRMRERGHENVGMVIQSCLYRSERDTHALLSAGTRFRLVKGAYKEPRELAYPKKVDVDANLDLLTKIIIDASIANGSPTISTDGRFPPILALGTHDEKRIEFALQYAEKVKIPKTAIEFQMLHGIRRDLQERLTKDGYPVRIYVPYGTHWYPYFVRRLAERPANLWFFVSNLFRN